MGDARKVLEELEKEITCVICDTIYQKPKLLSCNHYYCSSCIQKWVDRADGKPLVCPECRKETIIPVNGVASLQPAFFIERLIRLYMAIAIAQGKEESSCKQCNAAASVVSFCNQCAEFLCAECVVYHKKMTIYNGHVVSSMEELKGRNAKDILVKEPPPKKCDVHGEPINLFCFVCSKLICRDCTLVDHREHRFEFLNICGPRSREILRECLQPLREILDNVNGTENGIRLVAARVDKKKEDICRSIEQCFDKMMQPLEQKRDRLTKEVQTLAEQRKDIVEAQRNRLQENKKGICYLIDFVEKNLEGTTDQDLMTIFATLQKNIEMEVMHQRQLSPPAINSVVTDIGFAVLDPNPTPHNMCEVFDQHSPHVYHTFNMKLSNGTPNGFSSIPLGSEQQVTVSAPLVSLNDVSAELECVACPQCLTKAKVTKSHSGVFNVSFTPQVRGRHRLIIKVKEKEIGQSPFRLFVSLPITRPRLQYETKIPQLERPTAIAINSQSQLMVIVSAYDSKKVRVMDRDGTRKHTITCDHFRTPSSLASGSDGSVYVTDNGTKHLFKFTSQGVLLKTVINEFKAPVSVKIINHHVFVLDSEAKIVKIFDSNCEYRGVIEVNECPEPSDIALGPDGLYVAGEKNISVFHLAPNGEFLYNVNLSCLKKLSTFSGICFSCDVKLIVSDYKYGVYILEMNGDVIGHISSDVIILPTSITTDEDGFLYVCSTDTGNVFVI